MLRLLPKQTWSLWLVCILLILAVTMPSYLHPGDAEAVRAEAVHLAVSGHWGISRSLSPVLGDLAEIPGMYFFVNRSRGRLFAKYGPANTFLYLPVVLLEKMLSPGFSLPHHSRSFLLLLNVYQLLFAAVALSYLYALTGLFSRRAGVRAAYVLASVFCSYLWFYLRTSALEVFQIPAMYGFVYHSLRGAGREGGSRSDWDILFAGCWLGLLILLKTFFLLYAAGFLLWLVWFSREPIAKEGGRRWWRWAAALLPLGISIGMLGWANAYRFGSPLASGYGQWVTAAGRTADHFSPTYLLRSLPGFFWRAGNANLWFHMPLLLCALPVWPAWLRRNTRSAVFLLLLGLVTLLVIGSFSHWTGEFGYGPRYLLHVAVLFSLPALQAFEWMGDRIRRGRGLLAAEATLLLLLVSLATQVSAISLHPFSYTYTRALFMRVPVPDITAYFDSLPHLAVLNNGLLRHRAGNGVFRPLDMLANALPPPYEPLVEDTSRRLQHLSKPNYFFLNEDTNYEPLPGVRRLSDSGAGNRNALLP